MEHIFFLGTVVLFVFIFFPYNRKNKPKRKAKKFGEGLLTDRPDSGNLNIWKY